MPKKIISFLEYILLFFFIIEFNTPYTYFPFIRKCVLLFPIIILLFLLVLKGSKIKIDFFIIALLLGAFLPSLNVAKGEMLTFIRLYVILLPILVLYLVTSLREDKFKINLLFIKFANIVTVLAVISLVFWILGSILGKISYTALIPNDWGGDKLIPTYYGIYFETQEDAFDSQALAIVRNSGIFNEAPMYNMILCTALVIECFLRMKVFKIRILILLGTIVSTISTTGFIFIVLLFLVKVYKKFRGHHRMVIILCVPLLCLASFLSVSTLLDNKKEKEQGASSYESRSGDIQKCIEVGLENPVLGVELFHRIDLSVIGKNHYGYSNGLFTIFAHGGFYTLWLYLFALVIAPALGYRIHKDSRIIIVLLGYFLLFVFTSSQYKYLTILMMAVGLSYYDNYVYKNRYLIK